MFKIKQLISGTSTLIFYLLITFGVNAQKDLVISGGNTVSSFVCENRTAYVWGSNTGGQLGVGSGAATISIPTAVPIPGNPDVKQINSGSGAHFVALTCNGDVWAWGANDNGQVGNGASSGMNGVITVPTRVLADPSLPAANRNGSGQLIGASVVYSGTSNTFAILNNGRLVSWGLNSGGSAGQLGRGNTTDSYVANYVLTGPGTPLTGVTQIFCGDNVAYALVDPDGDGIGTVYSWGNGLNGTLGRNAAGNGNPSTVALPNGNTVQDSYARPVYYMDGTQMNNIVQLQAGDVFGIALDVNNYAWTWGNGGWNNSTGNTTNNVTSSGPAKVIAGTTTGASNDGTYLLAKSIGGGQGYGMAVTVDGKPVAWGGTGTCDAGGMTGVGNTTAGIPPTYIQYGAGLVHSNVTLINRGDTWGFYGTSDNEFYAWGCNNFGQLGIGNTTNQTRATKITPPGGCDFRDPAPFADLKQPNVTVCQSTFTSLLLNSHFTVLASVASKYTVTWFKNGSPVKSGPASVAGNLTYSAVTNGLYRVEIEYTGLNAGCVVYDVAFDEMTISYFTPSFTVPMGLTFCGPTATVNVNSTNAASKPIYAWYATAASTTELGRTVGSGSTIISTATLTGTTSKTVYVEEIKQKTGSVFANAQALSTLVDGSGVKDHDTYIETSTTLTLDSLNVFLRSYSGTATFAGKVQIYGNMSACGGKTVADKTKILYQSPAFSVSTTSTTFVPINIPVAVTLPPGKYFIGYTADPSGGTTAKFTNVTGFGNTGSVLTNNTPISDNIGGTTVKFYGSDEGDCFGNTGYAGYTANMQFSIPQGYCNRLPVTLTENCPCNKPTSVTVNGGTSPINKCVGDAAFTTSGSYVNAGKPIANTSMAYVWYKQGSAPGAYTNLISPAPATTTASQTVTARNFTAPVVTDAGTYILRVEDGNTGNAACYTEATVVINVNPKPTITSSATGTVCSGVAQNYTITSSVASTYTWTRAVVTGVTNAVNNAGSGTPITETLTLAAGVTTPTAVTYVITPTSTAGSCPGTAFNYVVTVNPKPTITSSATGTVCSGVAQNYTITSSVASTYTWTRAVVTGVTNAVNNAGSGTPITETLTLAAGVTTPTAVTYVITPTSTAGSCPGTAFNYVVTVNPKPTITSSATGTVCSGAAQNYAITSNVASTYTWTRAVVAGVTNAVNNAGTGTPITETLTLAAGVTTPTAVTYVITPTSTAGSCPGTAFNYVVTVNPLPTITSSATGAVCSGAAQNYAITSNVASTYTWTRAVVAGVTNAVNNAGTGTPIAETLTLAAGVTTPTAVTYVITPTSTAGSCPGTAFNYVVTVTPKPTITSSATGTVCSGVAQNYAITSSIASTYTWTRAVVAGVTNAVNNAGTGTPITETLTLAAGVTTPTAVTYVITPTSTAGSCPGTAFNYVVTVNPKPTITSSATGTVCTDAVQNYAITSSVASTYTWTRAVVTGITPATGSGTASPITETLTNGGTTALAVTYVITPTSTAGSCPGTAFNYVVTVNPKPTITSSATGTVCSGAAQNYAITSNVASMYTWTRAVVAGVTNAVNNAGTGTPITETLTLAAGVTTPTAVTYVITPTSTAGSCPGTAFNYVVTVNPKPTITSSATGTTCTAVALNYTITSDVASSYAWTRAAVAGVMPTTGSGSTNPITETLTSGSTATVTYVITPTSTSGGCPGTPFNYVVTISGTATPTVSLTQTPSGAICAGTAVTFKANQTNGGNPVYKWSSSVKGPLSPVTDTYVSPSGATGLVNGEVITVELTSDLGCANPKTATTSVTMVVTPNVTPTATLVADKTTICPGDLVKYTASSTNGGTATYAWSGTPTAAGTGATYSTTALTSPNSVTVTVTSSLTCVTSATAVSNAVVVTVNPALTPAVSISAATTPATSPTTICTNGSVTFTAGPTNEGAGPSYEWFINSVSKQVGASATFTTTELTASTDVVKVVLTSNAICVSPATANASMSIIVNAGITAGSIGSVQTICYGGSPAKLTELTASSAVTPSYVWEEATLAAPATFVTVTGGTVSNGGKDFTPPMLTSGMYYRRAVTDGSAPAPCNKAISNSVLITVRSELVAGVIGTSASTCSGKPTSPMSETTLPTGGEGAGSYTYQWQSSSTGAVGSFSNIPSGTGSTYNAGSLTQTMYYQLIETSGTCGSVPTNIVTKTISAPEVITLSLNDPGTVCSGPFASINFTATADNGSGSGTLSYVWTLAGNPVGTNSANYTLTPLVATDNGKVVKVVVSTSNGCNAGDQTKSVVLSITNAVTPTVSISTPHNPNCAGFVSTFTANSTDGGSSASYQWYVIPAGGTAPGTAVGSGGTVYSTSSLEQGEKVYVELTSSLGCLSTANPFKSNEILMNIKPIPTPMISEQDTIICSPNSVVFHGLVASGTTNSYQWKLGDKNIAAPQGTTRNYVASESGLYSLNEDNGTCNTTSQQVRLTVISKPVANAGADIYIKEGDLGYLNGSGGSIYNWSPATHLSDANGSTPSFRGVETLTYVLTVADATNTCKDTDEVTVFVVKPIRVPNVITVNGDGTNDDWEIENIEGYPNSIIEIYNRWGNLVWKSEGYPKNWDGTNFRNGQVLPDGTYFYIINLQSQIYDEPNTGWVQIVK